MLLLLTAAYSSADCSRQRTNPWSSHITHAPTTLVVVVRPKLVVLFRYFLYLLFGRVQDRAFAKWEGCESGVGEHGGARSGADGFISEQV